MDICNGAAIATRTQVAVAESKGMHIAEDAFRRSVPYPPVIQSAAMTDAFMSCVNFV